MIEEGYAWEYDGGTKQKNFEELREIRRSMGTLVEEPSVGDPLPEVQPVQKGPSNSSAGIAF